VVATDHCPFTKSQKRLGASFEDLPYGFPGVETLLPLLYSEGVAKGRLELAHLPRLLSEGPARVFGLAPRKGSLDVGADADIVIFDPQVRWRVAATSLHMKTDFSPYEGLPVEGAVVMTLSRGQVVFERGVAQDRLQKGEFVPCTKQRNGHDSPRGEQP
jgi:dihydropyrimidinase